jgi:hypothetical protein
MASVRCRACGNKIGSGASPCPHCGGGRRKISGAAIGEASMASEASFPVILNRPPSARGTFGGMQGMGSRRPTEAQDLAESATPESQNAAENDAMPIWGGRRLPQCPRRCCRKPRATTTRSTCIEGSSLRRPPPSLPRDDRAWNRFGSVAFTFGHYVEFWCAFPRRKRTPAGSGPPSQAVVRSLPSRHHAAR